MLAVDGKVVYASVVERTKQITESVRHALKETTELLRLPTRQYFAVA